MAETVKTPDYGRIWDNIQVIQNSDNVPAEERNRDIEAYLSSEGVTADEVMSNRPTTLGEDAVRLIEDVGRGVSQGMTMGHSDEISAWLAHQTGLGKANPDATTYEEELKAQRDRDKQISPYVSIPSEVGGAVLTTAATGGVSAPATIAKVWSQLPGWVRATGLGTLIGGAFGFGKGEGGLENRLDNAATGAVMGGATGTMAYPIIRGGQKVGGALMTRWRGARDPSGEANRRIAQSYVDDNTTAGQGRTQLHEMGPQAMIADTGGTQTAGGRIVGGENVLGLARKVANLPGAGKNTGAVRLAQRAEGEATRIAKGTQRNLSPKDYFDEEQVFLEKLGAGAQEVYRRAFDANPSIMTPGLRTLLTNPHMKRALKNAADRVGTLRAAGEGPKTLGPIDDELTAAARYVRDLGKLPKGSVPREGVARGFSLETWDNIRWGLEQVLNSKRYTNELTGRVNKAGYPLQRLLNSLTKQLDQATGGRERSLYAAARNKYGGEAEGLNALRDGKNFMNMHPREIVREMQKLSEAGQEAFRSGAARTVIDTVAKVGDDASAANRLFRSSFNRQRLAALFPDSGSFQRFSNLMRAEQRMGRTASAVGTGSRTAPLAAEMVDEGLDRGASRIGAATGSRVGPFFGIPALISAGIGRQMARQAVRPPTPSPEVNALIAQRMFSRNRAHQQQTLDAIDHLIKTGRVRPEALQEEIARMLSSGIATQGNRAGRYAVPALSSQVAPGP